MFTNLDRRPGGPDQGEWDAGRTGLPGRRATGLIARFGSLPFRQLAGPSGLFFLWPPKSRARTGMAAGGPP
jgi:hypothetical protein